MKNIGSRKEIDIMYLQNFIGLDIYVRLNELGKQNRTLKMFYAVNDIICNKLLGVDEVGIWLEGFVTGTVYGDKDENGNVINLEKPEEKELRMGVLIPWSNIDDIFTPTEENMFNKKIGF